MSLRGPGLGIRRFGTGREARVFGTAEQELEPGKDTDVRGWQDRAAAERVIDDAFARARRYERDATSRAR